MAKAMKITAIVGNIAMFIGCIFLILNLSLDKVIFPSAVTIPLMIFGIIGNVAALFRNEH